MTKTGEDGLTDTCSSLSLQSSSTSAVATTTAPSPPSPPPFPPTKFFGGDVRRYLNTTTKHNNSKLQLHEAVIDFNDPVLRQVMEPHLVKARSARTKAKRQLLANAVVPPYPHLRTLQRLEFSKAEFPLGQALQDLLQVQDLAMLHQQQASSSTTSTLTTFSKKELLKPLLSPDLRKEFHQIYQRFVCHFVIPHLHKRFYQNDAANPTIRQPKQQQLHVRYQAFPCIRLVRPGEFSIGPHCDLAYGHSIASLNVHVPLSSPIQGTNALYVETAPGKEDWQPLLYKKTNHDDENNGVAILLNGVECLHWTLENTTAVTRVSLDFRVALSRLDDNDEPAALHTTTDWQDRYTTPPGTYYAVCTSTWSGKASDAVQVEPVGQVPRDIDRRVGFPF